ncbi:hypothetical protein K432DRAFT_438643 [Lepidopterella palustris CBS 459.81]|uniref:Uncharacterized protein n=1 Tax=Lepidopterella palustris CBS 459.81 TaxID=1314670 RepID=A0A8E2ELZ3_9PEZI|nr:hypothetical protein K432DRAFT_438643 [Lepidopterella palustris CBS 459.81]
MRSVHTCFRTALSRAFRPFSQSVSGAWAVPEFLVPAISQPAASPRRASYSHRNNAQSTESSSGVQVLQKEQRLLQTPGVRPRNPRVKFKIPIPEDGLARTEMQSWIAALEPFLPCSLRNKAPADNRDQRPASAVDFSKLLLEAQYSTLDVLSHMGLVEGRWSTVMWIIKKLFEEGPAIGAAPAALDSFTNIIWDNPSVSLDEVTNAAILAHRARPLSKLEQSLKEFTSAPETLDYRLNLIKGALGQVWRSLGSMILVVAEEKSDGSSTIMSHILEIIAYLHHIGMIPEAVYRYTPAQDSSGLQQPPTLHLLSSRILTSLSDATWRAHESSIQDGRQKLNAQYFLGHEIPGSRYKITVPEIGPEIWIELVLWSCLHGGWILDGTSILEKMMTYKGENLWSLICWRDVVESSQARGLLQVPKDWDKLTAHFHSRNKTTQSNRGGRHLVQRTVSSEVVAAFVDGLINTMRVGVGARGNTPEDVVGHIKTLKRLLDRDNLSLGSMSWDGVTVRIMESEGVIPEKDPDLLLEIVGLSRGFGSEIGSINVPLQESGPHPSLGYIFDASAAPLGFLHRAIRAFIQIGNSSGALKAFEQLQRYTDENKMKSMTEFFQTLKESPSETGQLFSSTFAPVDFPGFSPQIPTPLLAALLDLVSESRMYDFGNWLLFSKEIDGPLIPRSLYRFPEVTPSIIRYGTATRNNDLLLNVVEAVGVPGGPQGGYRLPYETLSAFLHSQIKIHKWDSVKGIYVYAKQNPGYQIEAETLAVFARELLLSSSTTDDWRRARNKNAKAAFSDLIDTWYQMIEKELHNEFNTILGILSTVHSDWELFCLNLWTATGRQRIALKPRSFNTIMEGIVDGYGSLEGKRIVDMWCQATAATYFRDYRSPGGLPSMPKSRPSKGEEHDNQPKDFELQTSPGVSTTFHGRIRPDVLTFRTILRKAAQEEEERSKNGMQQSPDELAAFKDMLCWAASSLGGFGLDYEDILREFGSLAAFVEIKPPPATAITGWDYEKEEDECTHLSEYM